jgi:hypothetical protein
MMSLSRRELSMDVSALANAEYWLSWIGVAKLVAAFLVASGVVIEFGGDWVSRPFEWIVKEERAKETSALTLAVAEANNKAAEANKKAASLENDAEKERTARVQLEAGMNTEEFAREQLERWLAPRRLSATQIADFISKARPYAGRHFSLYANSEPEALGFARFAGEMLISAGWVQDDPVETQMISVDSAGNRSFAVVMGGAPGRKNIGVSFAVSVWIEAKDVDNLESESFKIASILVNAFTWNGIDAGVQSDPIAPDGTFLVKIGRKP